jgi:hypothetical protein
MLGTELAQDLFALAKKRVGSLPRGSNETQATLKG